MAKEEKVLLVGDNPFHGISHLSQERAKIRGDAVTRPEYAADLVIISLKNGANGFLFSVSETTLSVLRILSNRRECNRPRLYAIIPYVYEYIRLAILLGGVPGLAKKLAKQVAFSGNLRVISSGLRGIITNEPSTLLKAYLIYEVSRIKSSAGKNANIVSVLLHEVLTDMALALDMDWLFKTHIDLMLDLGIKPGFDTRNLPYLVSKFRQWGIDLDGVVIAAPFNAVGFQMCPSKEECEKALAEIPQADVIAFSLLAAGHLKLAEAIEYVSNLPDLKGVAVGVSKKHHASETFKLIKEKL